MSDAPKGAPSVVVENQPFDEAHDAEEADDVDSHLNVSPLPSSRGGLTPQREEGLGLFARGETPPRSPSDSEEGDYDGDIAAEAMASTLGNTMRSSGMAPSDGSYSESEEDDLAHQRFGAADAGEFDGEEETPPSRGEGSESFSSTDDESNGPPLEGAYNPSDFNDLDVKPEVRDLFQFITDFEPDNIELDTKLKPFIPDYIPAVGDIDPFIKVPRPDGKPTGLGLEVLDEPAADQSDPTVLDLHLRTIAKTTTSRALKLTQVQNAEDNSKAVTNWINSMAEVHRDRMPQTVHYTTAMPDLESLMQEWPPQVEAALSKVQLPSADLDVSLAQYTDIVCALLDIPVDPKAKNRVQALHLLFSLFTEFRSSHHFRNPEEAASAATAADDQGAAASL